MNKLFTNARAQLILTQPFFGTLCLRLKPIEDETMETGATDGVHLFYNPVWFEKLQPLERIGFLAHEVSSVVPNAVSGAKDAVDSDGNIDPQGIDQSKLVPLLVKTLQEAVAKIETLETKVQALEDA